MCTHLRLAASIAGLDVDELVLPAEHDEGTITCPVLVIRGAESDAHSDAQAADFAASLPHGRWAKVDNAGHTVQGDNPRGLVQALAPFLAEIGH
jgi:pimeloyl-ACP methyl ester carboxylesterase